MFDALTHGMSFPIASLLLLEDWNRLHKISQLIYTPEYIMYLAYQIANYKFNMRNSSNFSIPENPGGHVFHVLSFMAMPRSIPHNKARSMPDNKYDREEQTRFNFSPSREKDHQEATSTTVSDSFKLPPSVKLIYAMWGLPPPKLIIKTPVQNERVLGK